LAIAVRVSISRVEIGQTTGSTMQKKESAYSPTRHQRRLLRWAILADSLLIVALVTNSFRFEWFGIVPGYAPYNFAFNFIFFIPVVFTSALVSYFVAGQTLLNWKRLPDDVIKLLLILMTAPIPVLLLLQTIRVLRVN
jgi:hypothetical protein